MTITWHGHSCFAVTSQNYTIVLDPYVDVPGHEELHLAAQQVLCSHEHYDHNARACVTVTVGESPFTVEELPTFHDERQGALRGENMVHILRAEGFTVVHLGDLGHTLSAAQAQKLQGCDMLLLPIGGTYTIDAAAAKAVMEQVQPKAVIPMHYRHGRYGFSNIATLQPFLKQFPKDAVQCLATKTVTVSADLPHKILIPAE